MDLNKTNKSQDSDERNILQKAKTYYDKNVKLTHNLYNVLGRTLLDGIRYGNLDAEKLKELPRFTTANLGINLGKGYGLDVGYNQYIGERRQDLKFNISKKF